MCGFVFWKNLNNDPVDSGMVGSMLETLRHRGPDDWKVVACGSVAMGHCRLKVIDLETGDQPMGSQCGKLWVVFNGEIYNYLEWRKSLQEEGFSFRTTSDTEVLLGLYKRYGINCLERLNGMFSFVIWDENQNRLFAARDRLGKKPLYYRYVPGDRILLASEPKAILVDPSCPRQLNPTAFRLFLQFLFVPEGYCAFQGIEKLPPGNFLILENGKLSISRYWRIRQDSDPPATREEAIKGIRNRLDEAVRLRLRSDVPLGVFLSGGIDSTAVALSAARQLGRRIRTISVGFPGLIDERPVAREVARRCGSDHTEMEVSPGGIEDILIKMATLFDEPFADTSNIPMYQLAEKARELFTVVLSGDGGDELFAGYPHYLDHIRASEVEQHGGTLSQRMSHATAPLLRQIATRMPFLLDLMGGLASRVIKGYRAVETGSIGSVLHRHFLLTTKDVTFSALSPDLQALARHSIEIFIASLEEYPDPLQTVFHFDLTQFLPGDILKKVDMSTMAHGLENRSPLLDRELVEYAMRIPSGWKLAKGETKSLLKEVVAMDMGEEFVRRPKQGFGIPVHDWLRTPVLKTLVGEMLLSEHAPKTGLWNRAKVHTIVQRYFQGERDLAYPVWAILCGELWAREYRLTY